MCCLVEKEIPHKIRRSYSGSLLQHHKTLPKRAEEYVSKTLPGIVYGKLVRSNTGYLGLSDKPRLILIGAPEIADVASEFQSLADQWRKETMGVSSASGIAMHPAYQRIMAMGTPVLPLILRDLQQNRGYWFHALRYIAGEDAAAGRNSVSDARSAWLEWGYTNNYI